jgi:hypothetical protein
MNHIGSIPTEGLVSRSKFLTNMKLVIFLVSFLVAWVTLVATETCDCVQETVDCEIIQPTGDLHFLFCIM